jgi:hypothetical protein
MIRILYVVAGTVAVLLAACRPSARSERPDHDRDNGAQHAEHEKKSDQVRTTSPQEEPDTTPPADVSHGEAKIGGPNAEPAPVSANLAPAEKNRVHRIRLEMQHKSILIAPGVHYAAWTFAARCPVPHFGYGKATPSTSPW